MSPHPLLPEHADRTDGSVQLNPLLRENFTVPTVSFSVELGKHVVGIDFDYDEFNALAQQEDLKDTDISRYKIHYGINNEIPETGIIRKRKLTEAFGQYFPRKRATHINVDNHLETDKAAGVYARDFGIDAHGDSSDAILSKLLSSVTAHETGHYIARRQKLRSVGRVAVAYFITNFLGGSTNREIHNKNPEERFAFRVQRDHQDKSIVAAVAKKQSQ